MAHQNLIWCENRINFLILILLRILEFSILNFLRSLKHSIIKRIEFFWVHGGLLCTFLFRVESSQCCLVEFNSSYVRVCPLFIGTALQYKQLAPIISELSLKEDKMLYVLKIISRIFRYIQEWCLEISPNKMITSKLKSSFVRYRWRDALETPSSSRCRPRRLALQLIHGQVISRLGRRTMSQEALP